MAAEQSRSEIRSNDSGDWLVEFVHTVLSFALIERHDHSCDQEKLRLATSFGGNPREQDSTAQDSTAQHSTVIEGLHSDSEGRCLLRGRKRIIWFE
jgi:hypothetical protein